MRKILLLITLLCLGAVWMVEAQDTSRVRKSRIKPNSKESGIGTMTDTMLSYSVPIYSGFDVFDISFKKNNVKIVTHSRNGFHLSYAGSSGFERVGLLPKINGKRPTANDFNHFLRTGFFLENDVNFILPFNIAKKTNRSNYVTKPIIEANIGQYFRNGVIRNSNAETYNFLLGVRNLRTTHFSFNIQSVYSRAGGKLLNEGSNLSSVIGSMLMSQPMNENSYSLSQLPDHEKNEQFSTSLSAISHYRIKMYRKKSKKKKTEKNWYSDYYSTIFSKLDLHFHHIIHDKMVGVRENLFDIEKIRLSYQNHRTNKGGMNWRNTYHFDWSDEDLTINADYHLDIEQKTLDYQWDAQHTQFHKTRIVNEIDYGIIFNYGKYRRRLSYRLQLLNRHYFSNTATDYFNDFPSADLTLIFKLDKYSNLRHLITLNFFVAREITEASLVYNDAGIFSTILSTSTFYQYFESQGLYAHHLLKPEIKENYKAELSYTSREIEQYVFRFSVKYQYQNIRDKVLPFYFNRQFQLENVAGVTYSDWDISVQYLYQNIRKPKIDLKMSWIKRRSMVKHTANDHYIPTAGFNNISTGMLAGNSAGAIYGTTWLRDDHGNLIFGTDGSPLVNRELSMIGDPTPDFILFFSSTIGWKNFTLAFNLNCQIGGDKWNGTAAALHSFDLSEMGVGEDYIVDATSIRFSSIRLDYAFPMKRSGVIENITVGFSVHNIMLYTKYDRVDPISTLYNNYSGMGLDLFNIPGVTSFLFHFKISLIK